MNRIDPETGRVSSRVVGTTQSAYRPVDGFVVGGSLAGDAMRDIWILVSKPGEGLMEFFLEDDLSGETGDPRPVACLGLEPGGRLRLGRLDWESDRFLSELIDTDDDEFDENAL